MKKVDNITKGNYSAQCSLQMCPDFGKQLR